MKERPILFSAPMVRELLADRKTRTRRIVKWEPSPIGKYKFVRQPGTNSCVYLQNGRLEWIPSAGGAFEPVPGDRIGEFCPYGNVGDRLWVRETFQPVWSGDRRPSSLASPDGWALRYPATDGWVEYRDADHGITTRAKPAIHMPRWASRITLEITSVHVELLHDITEEEARAEGVERDASPCDHTRRSCDDVGCLGPTHRAAFAELWMELNGEESWDSNPAVWVIGIRMVEGSDVRSRQETPRRSRVAGVQRAGQRNRISSSRMG